MAKTTPRPAIPTKPTAVLCGKLQSQEFTDGAYALRDALIESESTREEFDLDEHRMTAALAQRIMALVEQGGDTRAGAIAAMANYFVIVMEGTVPGTESWKPLDIIGDGDVDVPHPLAAFFEVAGTPVTVTPDLRSAMWISGGAFESQSISIDLVRAIGKPISRKRFDKLRAKTEPRPRL